MDSDTESYGSEFHELDLADRDTILDDDIDPQEEARLKLVKTQDRQTWIVKLQFKQNGQDKEGSGFYINIPHPTHHVIFTAGHNLVGVENKDLNIFPAPKNANPNTTQIFVSAVYQRKYNTEQVNNKWRAGGRKRYEKATQEQEENDFGVILVEKNPKRPYLGFGFALKLGHDALASVHLESFGYKEADDNNGGGEEEEDDDDDDSPSRSKKEKLKWDAVESDGKCISCLPNQLEYDMVTEKGLSGSPVIMAHKDHDTAVAIHNYGPMDGRKSRGTRINEKVLDEIYAWLKIGFYGKALQASITSSSPLKERLCLVFIPDSDRAVVRLGYDQNMVTKFDILPAYAPPSNYGFPNDFRYAFRLKSPMIKHPEKRWVLWNAARQTVSLTNSLRDLCFVSLLEDKVRKPGQRQNNDNDKAYYVHVEIKNDQGESMELKELRVRAADLTETDLVLESLETSEVFFERHKRGKFLFGKIPCMPKVSNKPAVQREEFDFNLFRFYSG